jgi:hypothetical protein
MLKPIRMSFFPLLFLSLIFTNCDVPDSLDKSVVSKEKPVLEEGKLDRLSIWTEEVGKLQSYVKTHAGYNTDLAMFIDFKTPSSNFRFYVVDLKNGQFLDSGLVAHGSGSQATEDSLVFSNVPESYKSSLGYYKIGAKYKGNFGWSYKLHGLDQSNSNAYKRLIVLHPYGCVPDEEQYSPICYSLGCPMVSYNFMDRLYGYIDNSKKPILLKAFY